MQSCAVSDTFNNIIKNISTYKCAVEYPIKFLYACSVAWLSHRCRARAVKPGTGRRRCMWCLCYSVCGCPRWNDPCSTPCWLWPPWRIGTTAPVWWIRCVNTSIVSASRSTRGCRMRIKGRHWESTWISSRGISHYQPQHSNRIRL